MLLLWQSASRVYLQNILQVISSIKDEPQKGNVSVSLQTHMFFQYWSFAKTASGRSGEYLLRWGISRSELQYSASVSHKFIFLFFFFPLIKQTNKNQPQNNIKTIKKNQPNNNNKAQTNRQNPKTKPQTTKTKHKTKVGVDQVFT